MKEMPLQSLLRFLGKMTSNKIIEPGSSETEAVCDRILCETTLKKVSFNVFKIEPNLLGFFFLN